MGKKDKDTSDEPPPLNLNIGVMGHVDSGKTSLVKALSTTLSTASLDRAPQSQARGITLDLGFSSFRAPLPEHLDGDGDLQFTLVDCPARGRKETLDKKLIVDLVLFAAQKAERSQPSCTGCHATDAASGLVGVQCESCHGAGRHYWPEFIMKDTALARAVGLKRGDSAAMCGRCHTDRSATLRAFDVHAALRKVRHTTKGER